MDQINKPVYYINLAEVNINTYDVALKLGQKKKREMPLLDDEDIDLTIVMSPQHAKALLTSLSESIIQYEKMFGEIKVQPTVDIMTPKE